MSGRTEVLGIECDFGCQCAKCSFLARLHQDSAALSALDPVALGELGRTAAGVAADLDRAARPFEGGRGHAFPADFLFFAACLFGVLVQPLRHFADVCAYQSHRGKAFNDGLDAAIGACLTDHYGIASAPPAKPAPRTRRRK